MSGKLCKYYAQGNCRYGKNCAFSHIDSPLQKFTSPQSLDSKTKEIQQDLNDYKKNNFQTKPLLSSYGLGYPAVNNLISGRDLSFEEQRLQYLQAQSTNTVNEYEKIIQARVKDMDYCINSLSGKEQIAARYQQKAAEMPNSNPRQFIDRTLEQNINEFSKQQTSAFGANNDSQSNPFGSSSFTSNKNIGVFGNQGAFAPQANSSNPFGSQSNTSPFGSTSTAGSAFGSAGFGSTAAQSTQSGFGTSGFGTSGFGNASTTSASGFGSSGFGKSTTDGAFGSTGFGSATNNASTSSGFGSSGFGSAASSSPFASLSKSSDTTSMSSPFGSSINKPDFSFGSTTATPSAFGSSGFGSNASNPFATSATNDTSPFGAFSTNNNQSPFGAASTTTASPFESSSKGTTSSFRSATSNVNSPFGSTQTNSVLPFGSSDGTTFASSGFGSIQQQTKTIDENDPALKILDPKIIEAFKAAKFELGNIPEIPPPLSLCQ